jgi:site-specific recombinase XerD
MKRALKQIPSQEILIKIQDYLNKRANRKGEHKKDLQHCLLLLCLKAGLRVTEAIGFNLSLENTEPQFKNLFLLRGKRQKDREVYVSPEVISFLKEKG